MVSKAEGANGHSGWPERQANRARKARALAIDLVEGVDSHVEEVYTDVEEHGIVLSMSPISQDRDERIEQYEGYGISLGLEDDFFQARRTLLDMLERTPTRGDFEAMLGSYSRSRVIKKYHYKTNSYEAFTPAKEHKIAVKAAVVAQDIHKRLERRKLRAEKFRTEQELQEQSKAFMPH